MKVINREFNRKYEEKETLEAGVVLTGAEVKSVKQGNIKLENAFVKISHGEAYLTNAEIPIYKFARPQEYNATRRRKLLLHKAEIIRWETKLQSSSRLTIAPKSCYTKGSKVKILIALVKGRTEIGRKKLEKSRDVKREQKREMKEYLKS